MLKGDLDSMARKVPHAMAKLFQLLVELRENKDRAGLWNSRWKVGDSVEAAQSVS